MADLTREAKLAQAFVALADTLVADFDLVDLLQTLVETCTDLLDTAAAGLLLRDTSGVLHVVASTTEDANFVEVVQLGAAAGPCLACIESGEAVTVTDIEVTGDQWPEFRRAALDRGFKSVQATPLRLRADVIGAMNLFDTRIGALNPEDVATAQALSDVATIGILSDRAAQEKSLVNTQLQAALDSRVVIEQAKGVLAQSMNASMNDAFNLLRAYARNNNRPLQQVADDLVNRRLPATQLISGARRARPNRSGLTRPER
jgi:GAF domain-containing protein